MGEGRGIQRPEHRPSADLLLTPRKALSQTPLLPLAPTMHRPAPLATGGRISAYPDVSLARLVPYKSQVGAVASATHPPWCHPSPSHPAGPLRGGPRGHRPHRLRLCTELGTNLRSSSSLQVARGLEGPGLPRRPCQMLSQPPVGAQVLGVWEGTLSSGSALRSQKVQLHVPVGPTPHPLPLGEPPHPQNCGNAGHPGDRPY